MTSIQSPLPGWVNSSLQKFKILSVLNESSTEQSALILHWIFLSDNRAAHSLCIMNFSDHSGKAHCLFMKEGQ